MRDIRRPEKLEPVIKQLTEITEPDTERSAFKTLRELLIFAALLGLKKKKKISDLKLSNPVPWRVFEYGRKEGVVYLLGLMETRAGDILRGDPEADEQLVQIFEEYACGGLSVIADLLKDNPADASGFRSILDFLLSELHGATAAPPTNGIEDAKF